MNKPNKVKVHVDHETGYWCVEVNKQPPKPTRPRRPLLPRFWAWVERSTAADVIIVLFMLGFLLWLLMLTAPKEATG